MSQTLCPHCGKPLPNAEKLGWHLSRECPAVVPTAVKTTAANDTSQTASSTARPTS